MIKMPLLRASLAGAIALALAAPVALANSEAMAPAKAHRFGQNESMALKQSKITLPQAIAAAERQENGKALYARLGLFDQKPVYRVRVVENDHIATAWVDAVTGKVIRTGRVEPQNHWSTREKREAAALRTDHFTLDDAVALAQRHMTGTPIAARLSDHDKTLGYEVAFLGSNGRIQKLMVGPNNPVMAENTKG